MHDVKSYILLSLLSSRGKIFERLIAIDVSRVSDQNCLFIKRLFGFRVGRMMTDRMLHLGSQRQTSQDMSENSKIFALDLQAPSIKQSIKAQQQTPNLQHWKQAFSMKKISPFCLIILGYLLWNVYLCHVLQLVPKATAYADDCTFCYNETGFPIWNIFNNMSYTLGIIKQDSNVWKPFILP